MPPTLHTYAEEGNLEEVQKLLAEGVDVNLGDRKYGQTPLSWAAESGHLEVAKLLLEKYEADFNITDNIGRTPLSWAARKGHKKIVRLLLENGDSVDSTDKNKRTPISLAAKYGHMDVIRLLISFRADVEFKDSIGQTPLFFAALNGHFEVVQLLIDNGADVNVKETSRNHSPLSLAASNGNARVVDWLLAKGCEIDCQGFKGRTPLSWAAANGHDEVLLLLIAAGAQVNSKDEDQRTALSYASENGHTTIVQTLLERENIEFDNQDTVYSQPPLSWAAEGGHHEIVDLLLAKGAAPDTPDCVGHTPLLWAIRNGHKLVVDLLLNAKQEVDVIARDVEEWTPLSWAAHYGDEFLVRCLLSKAIKQGSPISQLSWAMENALRRASDALEQAVEALARANGKLEQQRPDGLPALSEELLPQAAFEEHAAVVLKENVIDRILEKNAYLKYKDHHHRTLLSWAAGNGHDAVIKLLLARGLGVDCLDHQERAPISWAAEAGRESTVRLLLENNMSYDSKDAAGRTPLSYAAGSGQEAVVRLLLHINPDPSPIYEMPMNFKQNPAEIFDNVSEVSREKKESSKIRKPAALESRDNEGYTPLLWAAKEGHRKVVTLLLDKGADINVKAAGNKSIWKIIEERIENIGPVDYSNLQDVYELLMTRGVDGQLLTAPVEENKEVDAGCSATVFYFLSNAKENHIWRRLSVRDVLENRTVENFPPNDVPMTCKWLHIPANNMRWIEIIMAKHYEKLPNRWHHHDVLKKELWTGLQHRAPRGLHHARFMKPTCEALPGDSNSQVDLGLFDDSSIFSKGLMLFMPYLHWETEEELDKMKKIIEMHNASKKELDPNNARRNLERENSGNWCCSRKLIWAYLDDLHPIHLRRTLDQFYYHTLQDTDIRDKDQTVTRYHTKEKLPTKKVVTMVDQLWLWVLPGFGNSPDTVITSFPQRSSRLDSSGRQSDKFTALMANIILQSHNHTVRNGYGLAEIICNECSRIYFEPHKERDQSLQFLDIYASSIGEITDVETQNFRTFQESLTLNDVDIASITVNQEIDLLSEIKDIRDELNIMKTLFEQQRGVLRDLEAIIQQNEGEKYPSQSPKGRKRSVTKPQMHPRRKNSVASIQVRNSIRPLATVEWNLRKIRDMEADAKRATDAIGYLLDLKQRQANSVAAIKTLSLSEETIKQGKTITFFTLITIIFLPLSFMVGFFAIQVGEFPRDASGYLGLDYVSKYMFSISAAIIVPSIIIALNMTSVEKHWRSFWGWVWRGIEGWRGYLLGGGAGGGGPGVGGNGNGRERERVMDEEEVIESGGSGLSENLKE